jgi:hypothetical protein
VPPLAPLAAKGPAEPFDPDLAARHREAEPLAHVARDRDAALPEPGADAVEAIRAALDAQVGRVVARQGEHVPDHEPEAGRPDGQALDLAGAEAGEALGHERRKIEPLRRRLAQAEGQRAHDRRSRRWKVVTAELAAVVSGRDGDEPAIRAGRRRGVQRRPHGRPDGFVREPVDHDLQHRPDLRGKRRAGPALEGRAVGVIG